MLELLTWTRQVLFLHLKYKITSFAPEIQNLPSCSHPRPSYADRCQQHAVIFKRTARLSRTGFKIVLFDNKESFDQRNADSNLKTFIQKMNLGMVMAEDGSPLDIRDCKESAGLKYSLPPLAAWPTPLCSNWSDLLIRKPKAPPSPFLIQPSRYGDQVFFAIRGRQGRREKRKRFSQKNIFQTAPCFFLFLYI